MPRPRLPMLIVTLVALALGVPNSEASASNDELKPNPAAICPPASLDRPLVQLTILLDTSGSMEGLLDQARARIWDVINDLAKARKNSQSPRFEVALYQYGSDRLPSSEGFLRCVQPFTNDLDLISDRLFALRISGSAEYCGMALKCAMNELSWSDTPTSSPIDKLPLRVIVIAGNEEFTQGPVAYEQVVRNGKQRGVFVNTIYCGDYAEGERTGWLNAAYLNGGSYHSIDTSSALIVHATPFDAELERLNARLNQTYVAFGESGEQSKSFQSTQDGNARSMSPAAGLSRVASKATAAYENSRWDLIDYRKQGKDVAKIPTQDLPATMRSMTVDQRRAYLDRIEGERAELQRQIGELARKRQDAIDEACRNERKPKRETLDSAIIKSIREQAKQVGFTFSPD